MRPDPKPQGESTRGMGNGTWGEILFIIILILSGMAWFIWH